MIKKAYNLIDSNRVLIIGILFVCAVFGLLLAKYTPVYAASPGYFSGGAYVTESGGGGSEEVMPSSYTYNGVASAIPQWVVTKNDFYNFLKQQNVPASSLQIRTGSAYIVCTMLGMGSGKACFDAGYINSYNLTPSATFNDRLVLDKAWNELYARLQNPNITVSFNVSLLEPIVDNTGYGKNTAPRDIFRMDLPKLHRVVRFRDSANGNAVVYTFYRECANPAGSIGLPAYTPDTLPTGSSNANCTTLWGSAQDADSPGTRIAVHVYRGGPAGAGGVQIGGDFPTDSSHNYSINISSYTLLKNESFYVYGIGVDAAGNKNGKNALIGSSSYGPCNTSACGPSFDLKVAANTSVTINPTITVDAWTEPPYLSGGGSTATPKFYVTIKRPDGTYLVNNLQVNYGVTDAKLLTASYTFTPTVLGKYLVGWNLVGSGLDRSCYGGVNPDGTSIIRVGQQPYFQVYGGDILAGIALGGTSGATANIYAYNSNSGTYNGAGTQVGAFASGDINSFVTANYESTTPSYLAFSNTTVAGSGSYGGGFGAFPSAPSFMSGVIGTPTTIASIGTLSAGSYVIDMGSANVNIGTLTIPAGVQVTILTTGNVFLDSNITYASYGLKTIPRLNIYASGNIVLDNDVSEIHGVFVAENGKFYTCGSSATTGYEYANLNGRVTECGTPLRVYGTVVSQELILGRTGGHWPTASGAAERFIQSPETWLPRFGNNPASGGVFDEYVSLPPIL